MLWFCDFAIPILEATVAWFWHLTDDVSHILCHVETDRALFDLDRKCQQMRWNLQEAEVVQVTS